MSADGKVYDLLVVGGGINGAGIARDAAGRGLSVLICEKDDLAQATSSASTKLIHGGLRYLERYEFRLVREALAEREVLLRAAPHIVSPMTFVLPHAPTLRPRWMIRAGLFLYDRLARRNTLAGSRSLDLTTHPAGRLLKGVTHGFSYSDCWVDDARLVVLNVMDAHARGADVMTRTAFTGARREGGLWRISLAGPAGARTEIHARALVNAAGPWVETVLDRVEGAALRRNVRLVKGSHIVVDRRMSGEEAYIFQNADNRIVFAIPYENRFCLIGTTDVATDADPGSAAIDAGEIDYLIGAINAYFAASIAREDVVWTYSGVRPLHDDGSADASAVTRDYVFDIDGGHGRPPLLSVFGGKLTTYRRLAEQALDSLTPHMAGLPPAWTSASVLPGGDLPGGDRAALAERLLRARPWLPPALSLRFARSYGTMSEKLLGNAASLAELGPEIAPGLYEVELVYLRDQEWARTADDVLWRRTKLGLHITRSHAYAVAAWFARSGGALEQPLKAGVGRGSGA